MIVQTIHGSCLVRENLYFFLLTVIKRIIYAKKKDLMIRHSASVDICCVEYLYGIWYATFVALSCI